MTGWRVGWMIGPPDVVAAATNLQSHETSNVSNVAQRAALGAVSGRPRARWPRCGRPSTAAGGRSWRCSTRSTGSSCIEPEGAFYAFPSVEGAARARTSAGGRPSSSAELADLCIDEAKVAVVPGEAFGAPGYFRMSYALGDEDLVEGVRRLASLFGEARS